MLLVMRGFAIFTDFPLVFQTADEVWEELTVADDQKNIWKGYLYDGLWTLALALSQSLERNAAFSHQKLISSINNSSFEGITVTFSLPISAIPCFRVVFALRTMSGSAWWISNASKAGYSNRSDTLTAPRIHFSLNRRNWPDGR